jgi:hypothetical protein
LRKPTGAPQVPPLCCAWVGMTRGVGWLRLESLRDGKKRQTLSSSSQHLIWTGLAENVPGLQSWVLWRIVHLAWTRQLLSGRNRNEAVRSDGTSPAEANPSRNKLRPLRGPHSKRFAFSCLYNARQCNGGLQPCTISKPALAWGGRPGSIPGPWDFIARQNHGGIRLSFPHAKNRVAG